MKHVGRNFMNITAGVLFAVVVYAPLNIHALLPLGGRVVVLIQCNDAVLAELTTPTPGSYMFPYITKYLHGPPTHPGQWTLGVEVVPAPKLCFVGDKAVGAGIPVLFYGTSAI